MFRSFATWYVSLYRGRPAIVNIAAALVTLVVVMAVASVIVGALGGTSTKSTPEAGAPPIEPTVSASGQCFSDVYSAVVAAYTDLGGPNPLADYLRLTYGIDSVQFQTYLSLLGNPTVQQAVLRTGLESGMEIARPIVEERCQAVP